jgi:hypothetical protein
VPCQEGSLLPLDSFEIGGQFLDFVPISWDSPSPWASSETNVIEGVVQNPNFYDTQYSPSKFLV